MHDPSSTPPGGQRDAGLGWRFFGVLLVVSGVVLTGVSGLCTTAVLMDPGGGPELGDLSSAAIVIGGPFILIGLLLWWGGVRAYKKGKRVQTAAATPAASSPPPTDTRPPEPPVTG